MFYHLDFSIIDFGSQSVSFLSFKIIHTRFDIKGKHAIISDGSVLSGS